jgi:hypothetical protein
MKRKNWRVGVGRRGHCGVCLQEALELTRAPRDARLELQLR